ncbi:unnamed protein product [marine sediment metagenome]|uniref:Uncharacterized protein n=1 Tax=marine sediment metagenome TaxID=412755 RepID=X0SES6_9ZZZZ
MAFDAIVAKIAELQEIAGGQPGKGRTRQQRSTHNKAQWAQIQAARVALDGQQWICSSSALF